MGHFNAQIGKGKSGGFIGDFGLSTRNERDERAKLFVKEEELVQLKIFFKLPLRRLFTQISPENQPEYTVRNQIDYILLNQRFRNGCLCIKTYPDADVSSDHVPLVGKFKTKFKKITKKYTTKRWDMRKLEDKETQETMTQLLSEKINSMGKTDNVEEILENYAKPSMRSQIDIQQTRQRRENVG